MSGRARPESAGELSDWDFAVDVEDFDAIAATLPALVAPLEPISQQWDRLSEPERSYYMLMLRGPVKVDLVFDRRHEPAPPWTVSAATLPHLDRHFWDWILGDEVRKGLRRAGYAV